MEIDQKIQFGSNNKLIHLLNISNMSREQIFEILDLAETYVDNKQKRDIVILKAGLLQAYFLSLAPEQKLHLN